ncbi:MAG: single-stranded DNA-binding protein [Acidimicrobiales bacterium]
MPTRKQSKTNETTDTETKADRAANVTKIGNLTRDPMLRFGKDSGKPFASFGLAVNEPKVPGDWAGDQRTDFYEVTCFGSLAEHVAESLTKGTRVVVTGRPELEHFAADDGTQRERKRILANGLGPDLRWAVADVRRTSARRAVPEPAIAEEF